MSHYPTQKYFRYSSSQRLGLLSLLFLIVVLQSTYWYLANLPQVPEPAEKQQWLQLQASIDEMRTENRQKKTRIFPFNPNFISDFKGYQLGMSVSQIDKLQQFRATGKFVNSAAEFQQLTGVSDSLLAAIAPYFKFPDWVTRQSGKKWARNSFEKPKLQVVDINTATTEQLKKIYGIGDGLSARILKEKEKFGAFVSMEQMRDVWGLSDDVIAKLNASFKVNGTPEVKKIKINEASVKELMQFPYFRYALAKSIVTYRSMNGKILNSEDLINIHDFPVDKLKIIALYLEF